MKPAWEDLGKEYEVSMPHFSIWAGDRLQRRVPQASSSVLIGDVDCTTQSSLCSTHGVSGYPTIKYYKDGDKTGQSYSGGRTLDALKQFTADTLEVKCQVADPNPARCMARSTLYAACRVSRSILSGC